MTTKMVKYTQSRKRRGELVGGGYFVFRRGKTSKRIKLNPKTCFPFEHDSLANAIAEAMRLANENCGEQFCVFQQVADAKADEQPIQQAAE